MQSTYQTGYLLGTADGSLIRTKFFGANAYHVLKQLQEEMSEVNNSVKSYRTYMNAKIKGEVEAAPDSILDMDLLLGLLDRPA
jgi:hypothetical protein